MRIRPVVVTVFVIDVVYVILVALVVKIGSPIPTDITVTLWIMGMASVMATGWLLGLEYWGTVKQKKHSSRTLK